MVLLSFFPATLIRYFGVWEEAQNLAGQMFSAWFQARLIDAEFGKNVANLSNQFAARANRPFKFQTPVNFSSPRTTKPLPSSRCVSAIQIVRPSESTAETQPKLPTGFAEIVSDYFPSISRGEILPLNNRKAVGVTAPFRGGCVAGFQCEQRRLRATTAVPLK